jgi:uncharacterized protein (UPF0261 family)
VEIPEKVNHCVIVLATLDTKGVEAHYLRERLRSLGASPLLMDVSMRYGDRLVRADISAEEVAFAAGSSLDELSNSSDLMATMETVVKGASQIVARLMNEGKVEGVIGIGGYTGSSIITAVMHILPFGFPKVMVSAAAGMRGVSNLFFDTSDIILFHSVLEISGLSAPVRNVLERAAFALWAMLCGPVTAPVVETERALAVTMMSPCEHCARSVRFELTNQGFQVIGFHANGVGDRAMEAMIGAGLFRGVIDLAPGAVADHLYKFIRDAGPNRLEGAGRLGVPQIVSTCGMNHFTPPRYAWQSMPDRRRFELDRVRTWFRASPDELVLIAETFAEKLNRSSGPVKVVIPLKGWSSIDRLGRPTYDPEEDRIFCGTVRDMLKKDIEVIEVDANMEDPEFSAAVMEAAEGFFEDGSRGTITPRKRAV